MHFTKFTYGRKYFLVCLFQNIQERQENKSQMTEFWKRQLTSTPKVCNLIWATTAIVYWQACGWPWVSKPWITGITSIRRPGRLKQELNRNQSMELHERFVYLPHKLQWIREFKILIHFQMKIWRLSRIKELWQFTKALYRSSLSMEAEESCLGFCWHPNEFSHQKLVGNW